MCSCKKEYILSFCTKEENYMRKFYIVDTVTEDIRTNCAIRLQIQSWMYL